MPVPRLAMLGAVLVIAACSGGGEGPSTIRLRIAEGGGQTAEGGDTLPNRIRVVASKGDGLSAAPNVTLTATVTGGGSAASQTTDANGEARFQWTLGNDNNVPQTLSITGNAVETPVQVTATATPATVDALTISGGNQVEDTDSIRLNIEARSKRNVLLAGRGIIWSMTSADSAKARITKVGVGDTVFLSGRLVGSVAVRASVPPTPGSAPSVNAAPKSVDVIQSAVQRVDVLPSTASVNVSDTVVLAAKTYSRTNVELTGRPISWNALTPTIATSPSIGTTASTIPIVGVAPGTARIVATSGSVADTSEVTVGLAPVASVELLPRGPANLIVNGTLTVTVTTKDAKSRVVTGRSIVLRSSNTSVATVGTITNGGAVVTAVSAGTTTITAESEGISSNVLTLQVSADPVATVTVSLATTPSPIEQADTVVVRSLSRTAGGITVVGRPVTWTVSDVNVASVALSGGDSALIITKTVGSVTVRAEVDGKSGSAPIAIVQPIGRAIDVTQVPPLIEEQDRLRLLVVQLDKRNRPVPYASGLQSQLNKAGVLQLSPVRDTLVGVALRADSALLTARLGNFEDTLTIFVKLAPVDSVNVVVTPSTVSAGQSATASTELRDRKGRVVSGRNVCWKSSDVSIATVPPQCSTTGSTTVTAVAAGSATIEATVEGKAGVNTLRVTQAQITSIRIVGIYLGGTQTPAPLNALRGAIDVDVEIPFDTRSSDSVQVLIGARVFETQRIAVGQCATTCIVKVPGASAAYTLTAGGAPATPRFLNGTTGISAVEYRVSLPTRNSGSVQATLANNDGFHFLVTPPTISATSAAGQLWYGGPSSAGNLSFEAIPVNYSGLSVASVTMQFGSGPVIADASAPFTATIGAASSPSYADYASSPAGELPTIVSATYSSGSPLLPGVSNASTLTPIRLDYASPTGGAFDLTGTALTSRWINAAYDFTTGVTAPTDAGVGLPATGSGTFEYSGCGGTTWSPFTPSPLTIPECPSSNANSAYSARLAAADRLGNSVTIPLAGTGTFGVDVTPPTVPALTGSLTNGQIFNGAAGPPANPIFDAATATDTKSGVATTSAQRILAHGRGGAPSQCVVGTGTPGATPITNPACGYAVGPAAVDMPAGQTYGWLSYRVVVYDVAGNAAPARSASAFVEKSGPTVGVPALHNGIPNFCCSSKFLFQTDDDVELKEAALFVRRPALSVWDGGAEFWTGYPASTDTTIGNSAILPVAPFSLPFDDVVISSIPGARTPNSFSYWTEPTDANGVVQVPSAYGGQANADLLRARATDQYNNNTMGPVGAIGSALTATSWSDWNIANPTLQVFSIVGTWVPPSSLAWPFLELDIVVPVTGDATFFRRVEWLVKLTGVAGETAWCHFGSSQGFRLRSQTATQKTFYTSMGLGSNVRPAIRRCVSAAPGQDVVELKTGATLTVMPILVRGTGEGLAGKPFILP